MPKICQNFASTLHLWLPWNNKSRLCGCHGTTNPGFVVAMVQQNQALWLPWYNKTKLPTVSQILTKTEDFPLNQNLTRANSGIHVATCVICN